MADRGTHLIISIILTLILGAMYVFGAFVGVLAFAKRPHLMLFVAIVATAIPLLVLWLIRARTRRTAPGIWQGTAIGIVFVVLLCGICNGMAVIMSKK